MEAIRPGAVASRPLQWLSGGGGLEDMIMSSCVRMSRNVSMFPFPKRCSHISLGDVSSMAASLMKRVPQMTDSYRYPVGNMDELSRLVLVENHQISTRLRGENRFAHVDAEGVLAVSVNGDDHICMQATYGGLALPACLERVREADNVLKEIGYASDRELGFLTASIMNMGSGCRAYVLLHLPGLVHTGQMESITSTCEKEGIHVAPTFGDSGAGAIYTLSNISTVCDDNMETIKRVESAVSRLCQEDVSAVRSIMAFHMLKLEDRAARAWGILSSAKMLRYTETLKELSWIRLAGRAGLMPYFTPSQWNRLIVALQSAHLQAVSDLGTDNEARWQERARVVRTALDELEANRDSVARSEI